MVRSHLLIMTPIYVEYFNIGDNVMIKKTKVINAVGNRSGDSTKSISSENFKNGMNKFADNVLGKSVEPKLHDFNYSVQFGLPVHGSIKAVNRVEAMKKLRVEIGNFAGLDISMSG